jgi:hypothetical protein
MASMSNKSCHCCQGTGKERDRIKHGRALSGLRLRAGISLRGMARTMGISHTYLWQMERGLRNWPGNVEAKYHFCLKDQGNIG